ILSADRAAGVSAPLSQALIGPESATVDAPAAVRHLFSDRLAAIADRIPQMRPRRQPGAAGGRAGSDPGMAAPEDILADPLQALRGLIRPGDKEQEPVR
ncbi:MAG: hypothetical protein KA156_08480, partial [Paracoccus sp.]|nr:hypothetical protein [Paracoccus sp. (in: a-proteobacteria)]